MFALYALLTMRVPVPRQLLLRGAVIVLAYAATAPYAETLVQLGLTPIKAAVALGLLASILWTAASALAEISRLLEPGAERQMYLVWGVPLLATLLMPSDLWLAYAVAASYAIYGGFIWVMWKMDPATYEQLNWINLSRPKEAQNIMTWKIWRHVWSGVAFLALARHATPLEWALGSVAIPVVFHYLFWWTVCATHPSEDETAQK